VVTIDAIRPFSFPRIRLRASRSRAPGPVRPLQRGLAGRHALRPRPAPRTHSLRGDEPQVPSRPAVPAGPGRPGIGPALDVSGPGMAQRISSGLMFPGDSYAADSNGSAAAVGRRFGSSTVVEHVGAGSDARLVPVMEHVGADGDARRVHRRVRGCRGNRGADHSRACDTERKDRRDDKDSPDAHDSSTTSTRGLAGCGRPGWRGLKGLPMVVFSISKRKISDHNDFCYLMKTAAKVPLFPAKDISCTRVMKIS